MMRYIAFHVQYPRGREACGSFTGDGVSCVWHDEFDQRANQDAGVRVSADLGVSSPAVAIFRYEDACADTTS